MSNALICECGVHAWAPIGKGYVTVASPTKAHLLEGLSVCPSYKRVYARCADGSFLHKVLAGDTSIGPYVDHANGDSLDNRDENLRPCTPGQNMANMRRFKGASIFKGVSRCNKKWRAQIKVNYKSITLGIFEEEIDAAKAYDAGAYKYFGEFALTNSASGLY